MKKIAFASMIAAALLMVSCGGQQNKKSKETSSVATKTAKTEKSVDKLNGAGATFPLPFYNLAFKNYETETGVNVTYGGVGSGGGIRSIKDKVVDFGGSDAYLSDKELAEMPAQILHIPTCMGAVVVAYNLDGVDKLNLTADIISKIYRGKITNWNDKQIAAINEGVTLPNLAITPAYRSDGSGTTFVFADYMTKADEAWAKELGTGKSLKWITGVAGKGNPGVAGIIKQTKGSIGYVGSEYAFAMKTPTASLKNANGEFIDATPESISTAANVEIVPDTRQMITNSSAKGAYPISCFTWIIFYKEQAYNSRSQAQAKATMDMLKWMMSPAAQELTTKVHYCPLPAAAVEVANNIINSTTYNGKPIK